MTAAASEPGNLTPDQAIREILRIEGHTGSLLQRAVGLTWMIWGVISGGIFVSYEAIGIAAPSGTLLALGYGLVWIPWVLLGGIATAVLWRSLALVIPKSSGHAGRITVVATATFLALVLGGGAVIAIASIPVSGPAWAMFAVGAAAAVVGGSGVTTDSRAERTLWLAGGASLAVLTVAISLIAAHFGFDPLGLLLVIGPVASTALLFGGGLYTTTA